MRKFMIVADDHRKHPGQEIALPRRGSLYSAGYDFFLPVEMKIPAGEAGPLVFLDIKAAMEKDEVLQLHIRSSLGIKRGLSLANTTGIIDADYFENPDNDGNIGIKLINRSSEEIVLKAGTAVVQGIFMKYLITDDDMTSAHRLGGFGSTG